MYSVRTNKESRTCEMANGHTRSHNISYILLLHYITKCFSLVLWPVGIGVYGKCSSLTQLFLLFVNLYIELLYVLFLKNYYLYKKIAIVIMNYLICSVIPIYGVGALILNVFLNNK